jgi:hypothetical protein
MDHYATTLEACRRDLLSATSNAALAAGVAGLGTGAEDPAMWIAEATRAVLRDLDRHTGTNSGDWDLGE